MHPTVVLALTAVVAQAVALPAKHVTKPNSYSIKQVETGRTRSKIGPVAHRRALRKYGVDVPDNVHTAAEKALSKASVKAISNDTTSGSVVTKPYDEEAQYLCPVTIGGKTLTLDFDTGSADLWVFSSELSSSETSGHQVFDTSSATKVPGETWSIAYGDHSGASGNVYRGDVTVGGVTATKQAIEAAQSISASFQQDVSSDGLLGLAQSAINTVSPDQQKTFFDTVKDDLALPLFTTTLKHRAAGSYDFGFINSSSYTGDITYVDADVSQGFWGFEASGYAVGDNSAKSSSYSGILDTGTSLWYMPSDAVKAYYATVHGAKLDEEQGGYTFPCDADLPSMSAVIGGATFTVPGSYIKYSTVDSTTCFGGLQDSSGLPTNIFGDIFLKAHFAVFSADGPKIGLAQQAGVDGAPYGSASSSTTTGGRSPSPSPDASESSDGGNWPYGSDGGLFGSGSGNDGSDVEDSSLESWLESLFGGQR